MQQLKVQDTFLLVYDSLIWRTHICTYQYRQHFQQDLNKNKINNSPKFALFLITLIYKNTNVYEHEQK